MAKDGSETLDAVVIPTLFLGELKYSPDEIKIERDFQIIAKDVLTGTDNSLVQTTR